MSAYERTLLVACEYVGMSVGFCERFVACTQFTRYYQAVCLATRIVSGGGVHPNPNSRTCRYDRALAREMKYLEFEVEYRK